MVESISNILFELIIGFVLKTADAIGFVSTKVFDLVGAIGFGGTYGFLVSAFIVGVVAFFVLRFVFHSGFIIILLIVLLILLIIAYGYFDTGGSDVLIEQVSVPPAESSTESEPILQPLFHYVK